MPQSNGRILLKDHHPTLNISSAGISALVGHAADDKAIHCMDQLNIDMRQHVARQLNAELIKQNDLILVMSNNQQKHIEQTWPFAKGKIFRLGHWQGQNVPDPYQHDQAFLIRLAATSKAMCKIGALNYNCILVVNL